MKYCRPILRAVNCPRSIAFHTPGREMPNSTAACSTNTKSSSMATQDTRMHHALLVYHGGLIGRPPAIISLSKWTDEGSVGNPLIDVSGQRFGRLVVLSPVGQGTSQGTRWQCRCDCGASIEVRGGNLRSGNTKSCGCLHGISNLAAATHGKTNTTAYWRWRAMIQRCTNPRHKNWENYGGRGIAVCDRWRNFKHFYADMGDPPSGLTLDRIDVNGDYNRENCRWATPIRQMRNTRRTPMLTFQGETLPLIDWAERVGINFRTIHTRLRRDHWSIERALTTPVRGH